jgi:hypothetical protein
MDEEHEQPQSLKLPLKAAANTAAKDADLLRKTLQLLLGKTRVRRRGGNTREREGKKMRGEREWELLRFLEHSFLIVF